jgi:hypothetical protein
MSIVGLHVRMAEPGAQLVQGREIVFKLPEGRGPPAPRQVLQQLGGPGVGLSRAIPDYTGNDVVMKEEVIGGFVAWIG